MIDTTLTMIPGPTPVHERILARLAEPTISHVAPSFVAEFAECLANLKRIVFGDSAHSFVVSGAGTLAMEMALANLVGSDERLLIVSQGYFGDRWAELAAALGLEAELLQAEWGSVVAPEQLERRLAGRRYGAVTMTHVDTSTGAAAPVEQYCRLLREREEIVILDGVCATAGMEERFDSWGVDALVTGAQKALAAPPGVAILLVSPRAMDKRESMGGRPVYYADLLRWRAIMEDPSRYFSTPPVNQLRALHEATRIVLEEGLEARFARHGRIARAVRSGMSAMGLESFTASDCLADTLSVLSYPPEVSDARFRQELARRGVVVAGALGAISGRAFRVGHMGNIGPGDVSRLLVTAEGALTAVGHEVPPGTALRAAAAHLSG